jgi:surface-anchored protein
MTLFVSPVSATVNYTLGHGDIGMGEGSTLELHLHAHAGAIIDGTALAEDTEFEPDEAITIVPGTTKFARPEGSSWDFLGNTAGADTWRLPSNSAAAIAENAPFLGIGAEEIDSGVFVNDRLTLTLIDVVGPGYFSLYKTSLGTPTAYMTSFGGISGTDSIIVATGGHSHYNFGFSQPGSYNVTFAVSAVNSTTLETETSQATYTFNVVPEPTTIGLLALGALGLIRKR